MARSQRRVSWTRYWRPVGHPDADTTHFAEAGRSELFQIALTEIAGKQWLTAPELSLAPKSLQHLIGTKGAATHASVTRTTVQFLTAVLANKSVDAVALRTGLPTSFELTHRPALAPPAIRADGRLTEPVWRTARILLEATTVAVRVAEDCDWMYVAVVPTRANPFITELFLRPPNVTVSALGGRDLLLHASASQCWVFGVAEVAAADCNKNEAWWGASRTSQAGERLAGEYFIAKRAIGLRRCDPVSEVSLGALVGGWGPNAVFPAGAEKAKPLTWARASR